MIIKPNPNRGRPQVPDTIVIHAMSEYINEIHASDFLEKMGLSAHYLIEPSGEVIQCLEPDYMGAHALNHNVNSIGIEVLVEGNHSYAGFIKKISTDWVKIIQMNNLVVLCKQLKRKYNIKSIVRHSDIDPERKKDPGSGFNWEHFREWV